MFVKNAQTHKTTAARAVFAIWLQRRLGMQKALKRPNDSQRSLEGVDMEGVTNVRCSHNVSYVPMGALMKATFANPFVGISSRATPSNVGPTRRGSSHPKTLQWQWEAKVFG